MIHTLTRRLRLHDRFEFFRMGLNFTPVDTQLRDLQLWHAESSGYAFAISHESRSRPGLHGEPGFIASWRRKAIALDGSPFAI